MRTENEEQAIGNREQKVGTERGIENRADNQIQRTVQRVKTKGQSKAGNEEQRIEKRTSNRTQRIEQGANHEIKDVTTFLSYVLKTNPILKHPIGQLCIALIGIVIFFGQHFYEFTTEDNWLVAKQSNTPEAYCTYAKTYPYSFHKYEADLKCSAPDTIVTTTPAEAVVEVTAAEKNVHEESSNISAPNCDGDCENGYGTYTYKDGNIYTGEFKNGEPNGQGTFTSVDGDISVGEFNDGELHGQGTITFANGEIHTGEFNNDQLNGQGTVTFTNGEKLVGIWVNDEFIK